MLWINPATNIWSVLYAPKALTVTLLGQVRWVFECFSPCTKINISHFAVKHSSFPTLAHGEVKGRSVKMSDSLDFGHIHFVTQQLTFSLLFYYYLSQNVMTRPPIWNQTVCDKKESPQCVGGLRVAWVRTVHISQNTKDKILTLMCRNADCIT